MKSESGAYLWGKLVIRWHVVWEYLCILTQIKVRKINLYSILSCELVDYISFGKGNEEKGMKLNVSVNC